MYRVTRLAAASFLAGATLLGAASSTFADIGGPIVGHVYVNNNTAGVNTVSGFDRHLDGSLTPIPGTPFAAGGVGLGSPTGSAGALQLSGDGRYLLAVDAASSQISVLRIESNGALQLIGSPVASGGTTPVSIAVHNSLVFVANTGVGGSNYTGFFLGPFGHLWPLPGSTFALPDSALPGTVLFSGDGTHLIGTRVGTSLIDSFRVGFGGRLEPAPGSPFPAQGVGPFGSAFRPTKPNQLFVSNAHNGGTAGTVSAFTDAPDGTLSPIGASPYADLQSAPCWVAISPDGQYLFAINTGSSSISSYEIDAGGSLNLLASTPFNSATGLRPFDAQLDPSGHYLYVVDAGQAKVSAFRVSGGALTEVGSSPFSIPGGGSPFGIVVD